MSARINLAGFTDPVGDAQATFRAVLDAMSRPGTLHQAGAGLTAPAPLDPAAASVLLTLVDNETPLWLDDASLPARDWLAFHCGAVVVAAPDRSMFALALGPVALDAFSTGTDEVPEASTTLLLQVPALGSGVRYRLAGPGLREPGELAVSGLPAGFATAWQRNHALYPRGVDIILCAGTTIAALPRSVSIEEA